MQTTALFDRSAKIFIRTHRKFWSSFEGVRTSRMYFFDGFFTLRCRGLGCYFCVFVFVCYYARIGNGKRTSCAKACANKVALGVRDGNRWITVDMVESNILWFDMVESKNFVCFTCCFFSQPLVFEPVESSTASPHIAGCEKKRIGYNTTLKDWIQMKVCQLWGCR